MVLLLVVGFNMSNNFLERVRMSNIFEVPRQYNYVDEPEPIRQPTISNRQPRVQQIGQRMAAPMSMPQQEPMNVVLGDQGFNSGKEILRQSYARTSPEMDLAKGQLAVDRERNQIAYGTKQRQLDIQQQRADAYDYKAKNPNAIIKEVGGRMVAINPQNPGQTVDLGDSRYMDEADKIALMQTNRLALEDKMQTGRESIQTMRGQQEMQQIGERGNQTRQSQAADDSRLLPTQQARDIQNKYNILINKRPEFRDFIKLSPEGMPVVTPSGKGFFGRSTGPTPEQFAEINQFLFGNSTGNNTPTATNVEIPPNTNIPVTTTQTGTISMQVPGIEKPFNIPPNKLADFRKDYPNAVEIKNPNQPAVSKPVEGVVAKEQIPAKEVVKPNPVKSYLKEVNNTGGPWWGFKPKSQQPKRYGSK